MKNGTKTKEKHMEYIGKKVSNDFHVKNSNFLHNQVSLHSINTNQQKNHNCQK